MPIARISLRKGKPPEFLRALSDSLHQAMVESFAVPPDDCFHVIHQLEPHELIFDRHYLAGLRSDDYVLIAITAGRARDMRTKRAFYRRLAELLQVEPGIRPEDVMVVINTTRLDDWSFGDGIATMVTSTAA